jgi:hypothetical protein
MKRLLSSILMQDSLLFGEERGYTLDPETKVFYLKSDKEVDTEIVKVGVNTTKFVIPMVNGSQARFDFMKRKQSAELTANVEKLISLAIDDSQNNFEATHYLGALDKADRFFRDSIYELAEADRTCSAVICSPGYKLAHLSEMVSNGLDDMFIELDGQEDDLLSIVPDGRFFGAMAEQGMNNYGLFVLPNNLVNVRIK